MSTLPSPAASLACAQRGVEAVGHEVERRPALPSRSARAAWWVSTKTGAWYGGSSPHQPRQSSLHSPRIGPNMLRPITYGTALSSRSSRAAASAS